MNRSVFRYLVHLSNVTKGRFLLLSLLLGVGLAGFGLTLPTAQAATNNTLNFQARLQTNPGGAIVPDGNYNIEFKLYDTDPSSGSSQGSCTGDSHCLWTETYTGGSKVRVAHGYLTVNLGSITSFPSTINWDQNLYITMNVGGTGSPSWNGEMSPRLALTGVPYAFRAGQLAKFGGTYTSTLSLASPTGGNQTFQIGDHGAAGTYTLLDNVSGIQNTTSPQTANIAIASASSGSVATLIQGAASQSVDILDIKADGVANPLFSIGNTGQATFRNSTDSTTAFQIQNAGGSSMFTVDTSGSLITTTDLAPKTAGSHAGAANVVTTIDTISAGLPPSIALGSDGFARMTYLGNNNLPTLARCTNADCTSKNITTVSASAMGITSIPVVVASDGFPRIAYFLNSSSDLVFVQCLDADCTTKNSTSVDTTGTTGIASSLVMGNDGFARMAFRNGSNFLSYIQCTNASCSTRVTTTVDNSVTVGYTSIGLGSDGFARMLYADTAGGVLKFVQCTNDACSTKNTTTLDATTTGSFSSITIASTDGFPRISYYDSVNTALKYLRCTNAACTTNTSTTVDAGYTGDFSGLYSSIAVASDGFARIAYSNQNNNVGYVQCTNTDCTTSNLSVADAVGTSYNYPRTLAMALGSDNFARIVDTTNVLVNVAGGLNIYTGTTRYVRMTSASGQDVLSGTQIGSAINPFGQITTSGLSVQGGAVINSSSRPGYYALSLQGDGNAIQALSSAGDEYFSIKSSGLSYRATDASGESSLNVASQGVVIGSTSTLTTNATLRVNQASGAGNALTVNNNGTGNLASFQKAGNDAFTIGNTGTILAQNTTNTGTAYRFQNVNGTNIVNVGTTSPMTNLLSNGDFETATTTWTNKGTGALTRVTTAAAIYYGQAGGQDVLTAANDGAAHTVTLTNGNTYTLSVYLRASTGTATNVNIGYTTGGGDQDCLTNRTVPSTGFTRFTCTFTASAAGTAIYVKQSTAVSETIYIDAVQLTNGSATSTPFSLGTLQLNGAVTSPVVIQPANDSTSAFQIQNSAGTSNLFVADTVNNAITSGGSLSVTGNVGIGGILQVASAFSAFLGATITSNSTVNDTMQVSSTATSGTITNGIIYNRNGAGGTTTNGINVTNTAGTLTNGLAFNGTIGTDITRTSGTLSVNGASGINLQTNGSTTASLSSTGAALFKNTSDSSSAFQVQNAAGNNIVSVDTTASANNYITNSSFETNTTGWAATGSASISQNSTAVNSYHLTKSLQVTTTALANDGVRVNTFNATPNFATSATWTLSFRIKLSSGTFSTLQAGYNVGASDVTCTLNNSTVSTNGFLTASCPFSITTGQTIASLFIRQSDATARTFYVDAVQLNTGSTAMVYQPAAIQLNGVINSPVTIMPASDGDAFSVQSATSGQSLTFNTANGSLVSTGSIVSGSSIVALGGGAFLQTSASFDSLQVSSSNAGTQTNGITYTRNAGGTTTNGINVTNGGGTLTNGLAFSGTIGTDINRASGTLSLNGAGGINLQTNGTTTMSLSATGATLYQNSSNSTNALTVKTATSGTNQNVLNVDTTNERVTVGAPSTTDNAKLNIYTSSLTALRAYENSNTQNIAEFSATSLGVGSVTVNNASPTITGSGTSFTTTFKVGDSISVSSATPQLRTILSITSDTVMTATTNFSASSSGAAFYNASAPGAGTVATTSGSATVTGTGTSFTSLFKVGDSIAIDGEGVRVVAAVGSNTSITLAVNATNSVSSKNYARSNIDPLTIKPTGVVGVNTLSPQAAFQVQSQGVGQDTLRIQGVSGQTSSLLIFLDSNNSYIGGFSSSGLFFANGGVNSNGGVSADVYCTCNSALIARQMAASSTVPTAVIQAGATPTATADLLRMQDSSTNALAGFNNAGQLYLGRASGATGSMKFFNSANAFTTTINASTSASASYTLTLPTALGSSGDCLKDTGSGVLGFAACGGGSGVTTVGTFSGSSQTNGANITGTTITFGPADGTNPGMVTTGTQTLAGDKTLSGNTTLGGTLNQSLSTTSTLASFTSGNSGTQTNGLLYTRNTGGTTTNGINIVQSAGTLTNGLAFGGTIGTDIMRASGVLTLSGASGVRVTSGAAFLGVAGPSGVTGSLTFQNGTNSNTATLQSGSVSSSYTLILPTALGSSGDCIRDTGGGILGFGGCVTSIGTINSQTKSANGAVISGSSLVLQTADATNVGLVSTGTQTIAGDKTLTGATLLKNTTNSTAAFQIQDSSANVLLSADTTNGAIIIGQRPDTSGTDTTWTKVSQATAGTIKASGTSGIGSITASAVYNGSLYVGTTKSNSAEVYRYDGSSGNWTVINTTAGTFNGGTTAIDGVSSMIVFNGMLYIGTSESTKAEMYRYDGGTGAAVFTKSSFATAGTITSGGTSAFDSVSSMAVVNGQLYVGANKSGNASVYLFGAYASAGSNFLLMGTAGACGSFTAMDKVTSMVGMNSTLYVAMSKGASQAALCVLDDNDLNGVFKNVNGTLGSFNDFYAGSAITSINSIPAMTVFDGRLVIAIEKSLQAGVLQMVNPAAGGDDVGENFIQMSYSAAGQIDNGGTNFINSVTSMAVYNGTLFIGTSKSNAGEIYRYDNGYSASAEWTKVSQATAGTIAASGTASIDTISTLIPYNGKLYAGTNEGTSAEIYENNVVSSQSYALQFHAAAPGTAEANGLQNLGQISFLGDASGLSGANINNTGAFLFSHSLITSAGAYDVAEDYATRDANLEPGDIVAADSEQDMVKKARGTSDSVVGIYSEKPALRLSQEDVTINGGRAIPIALAGRVPVKVTTKGGAIQPGDLLAMSDVPGVAVKASKAGFIIGRSLGYYSEADTAKVGKVMIFINLSWYDPSITGTAQQGGTSNQDATQSQQAGSNGQEQAASANVLTASDVTTSTLTVTGSAVFKGNVGIVGQLAANDLQLSGHITTKGDAPKLDLQAYAGSQVADAVHQAKATIVGNDIGGKITINVGDLTDDLEPGDLVKVTFNKKYSGEPQVMLTARNAQAARLGAYVEQATDEYFIITVTNPATAGTSYTFSYYVFQ